MNFEEVAGQTDLVPQLKENITLKVDLFVIVPKDAGNCDLGIINIL